MQRSHKNDKMITKTLDNSDVAKTVEQGEDGDNEEAVPDKAGVKASINHKELLKSLTLLNKELKTLNKT